MNTPPADRHGLPQCVVNCAVYTRGGKRREIGLDEISDALSNDNDDFVWVGLYEPEDAILEKLQEEFCLHDLAVEDARNAHQRPKIETYGNSLFIVVHTAQSVDSHIRFGETHIFVGPRYLVTVRHGASTSYAPARARYERDADDLAQGGVGQVSGGQGVLFVRRHLRRCPRGGPALLGLGQDGHCGGGGQSQGNKPGAQEWAEHRSSGALW